MRTTLQPGSITAITDVLNQYQTFLDTGLDPQHAREALLDALTVPVGGQQDVANLLRTLTGRTYSRQAAHGLYLRREDNHFPGKQQFTVISATIVEAFSLDEVTEWQQRRRGRTWR